MGDTSNSSTEENKPLYPVYSVTNIQNKIRVLDGVKVTHSSWVKLFKLHAHGYDVLHHIDGTQPPAKTDPSYETWSKIDFIVLQWIYGSLSDGLLVRVLESESTAQQAWNRIQAIILNNKNSRAATLEHTFTTTTLASCSSMNDYFQKMKDLAEQLKDVGHEVSESRLVLQMTLGLPAEYDTVASFITQAETSWDDAREMIDREQRRQAARQQNHTQSALMASQPSHTVHSTPTTQPPSSQVPQQPFPYHPSQHLEPCSHRGRGHYRGRGRGYHRGGRDRGRYQY
ncbi:hypothetical protein HanRHA438_Chr11g0480471 [Helianthus annuus]|nr:hypothetical protein HanRHA438_Chr11g0480471 [Helianthus annuus]